MREYSIAAIPADGIGPEVIAAGLEVLQTLTQKAGGFRLKVGLSVGLGLLQKARCDDAAKRPQTPWTVRRSLFWCRRRSRRAGPHHALWRYARASTSMSIFGPRVSCKDCHRRCATVSLAISIGPSSAKTPKPNTLAMVAAPIAVSQKRSPRKLRSSPAAAQRASCAWLSSSHGRHEIQRAAPGHSSLGRDRGRGGN